MMGTGSGAGVVPVVLAGAAVLVLFLFLVFKAKWQGWQIPAATPVFSVVSGARSLRRKEAALGCLGFSKSNQRRKERSEGPTLPPPLWAELALGGRSSISGSH